MAKRFEIDAVFRAVDQITAPIRRMSSSVAAFAGNAEARVGRFSQAWQQDTRPIREFGATAGRAALIGAALTGAALRDVVQVGAEFEQTLASAGVKFTEPIKIGTREFEKLREVAQEVGTTTEFTAAQSAGALMSLGAAGENASVAMGSLRDMTNLATVGQMGLDEATSIAVNSMAPLGLATDDLAQKQVNYARATDLLAKGADISNQNVTQLSEAVASGALAFTKTGQSAESFIAVTAALANVGITGSKAGLDAARIMQSFTDARGRGARALKKLDFDPFNADGSLKKFTQMTAEVDAAMRKRGLTADEQAVEWGKIVGADSRASMLALVDAGAPALQAYEDSLIAATGYAKTSAEAQRDTTLGALKDAESTIEAFKLEVFDAVKGDVKELLELAVAWGRENKAAIGEDFRRGITWLRENFDRLVFAGKALLTLVVVFKSIDLAVKALELSFAAVRTAQILYNIAAGAGKGIARGLAGAYKYLTTQTAAGAAVQKTLNTEVGKFDSKAGKAGAAVGVLAAAYAGFEAGTFIDEQTGISDTLADMATHAFTARDALLDLQDVQASKTAGELKDQIAALRDEQKMIDQSAGAGTFAFGVLGAGVQLADTASGRGAERALAIQQAEARLSESEQTSKQVARQRGEIGQTGAVMAGNAVARLAGVAGENDAAKRALAPTVISLDAYRRSMMRTEAEAGVVPGRQRVRGGEPEPAPGSLQSGTEEIVAELRKLNQRKDSVEVTIDDKSGKARATGGTLKPTVKVAKTGTL